MAYTEDDYQADRQLAGRARQRAPVERYCKVCLEPLPPGIGPWRCADREACEARQPGLFPRA